MAAASQSNPAAYQHDSLHIGPNEAQLFKGGTLLVTVNMNSPALRQTQTEVQQLGHSLAGITGKSFNSELAFFEAIKAALAPNDAATVARYSATYKPLLLNESIAINSVLVLVGILGFIAGFSISLGPVMWTMLSEIFPNKLRGLAISVVGALNALTSFTVATLFPGELEYIGSAGTFLIFGVFMVLCLLFVLRYVPETKGKSLEEIETELVR